MDNILEISDLRTHFLTHDGAVRAVDGIDLSVPRGSTVCVVGESGSGKSATARSILQLLDEPGRIVGGQIRYRPVEGQAAIDLAALKPKGQQIRAIRGKEIAMVFQEPMSALSPVHTIGKQITQVLRLHEGMDKKQARARAIEELENVGIPRAAERIDAYTFQLSGGMRQRAMIAMALVCRPNLLIADEPTTAIDVTTQAQVLDLLADLKARLGMTLLFITHDLGVVAEIADHVAVMNHGKIVEFGSVDQIFHAPQHDYTRSLLDALPQRHGPIVGRVLEPETAQESPLISLADLRMEFPGRHRGMFTRRGRAGITAVDGVSLRIRAGETLGLVGESGSGKTTLGRCIMRAYQPTGGKIVYTRPDGSAIDLTTVDDSGLRPCRREIRMVFQDPYNSLNPRMTVRQIIAEPLRALTHVTASEADDRIAAMLRRVGLRADHMARYAHAFSGGERQRIGIARALITEPRLVVADEAVSALDVSVRSQVLELLASLQQELGLTYLFISHDLSVVRTISDRVAVMYKGSVVEHNDTAALYADPQHPYTRSLLEAVPIADPRLRKRKSA